MLATAIVRSSDPNELLFWCVVGFCAGIGLFFQGFRLLQRRRLILDTPFSKIRSAPMGLVEINGLAIGPYTMVAPITSRPCYYYRTLVWEWKQSGKNKQWVKVAGECMHVPFFVDDNTGRLLVDPRGADLDLHRDFQQEFCDGFFTTKSPAPPNVTGFLTRHGIVTSNKIKVEEFCIKPKNSLFILGTLAENPGPALTSTPIQELETIHSAGSISFSTGPISFSTGSSGMGNIDVGQLARHLVGSPLAAQTQVHLTTDVQASQSASASSQQGIGDAMLKAGISKPAAWAAAGLTSAAGTGVQTARDSSASALSNPSNTESEPAANGFDAHPRVLLMKGANNKTFLISWRSQREVARALGWKCTLMIWGGPVLTLLSLYFFLGIEKLR